MPEIGEVARVVKLLNKHAAGKVIKSIVAPEDTIVFKDTIAATFKSTLEGRTIVEARQWGKYFWLIMNKSPHPLMHLGMTGWIHVKSDPAGHYRAETNTPSEWPPKFTKFIFNLDNSDSCAFVDPRRLGRIRLIDSSDGNLRPLPPLSENGPDPYIEPPTIEFLTALLSKRKVPIKALLLDQSALAGIGNWVADEILFQARLYPEIYTNTMSEGQIKRLHEKMIEVVKIAVETNAESDKFPSDWLMKHRWGKGKKDKNVLPSGEKVEFLKVGGRTTAYVPSCQKKNEGSEADEGEEEANGGEKPKTKSRTKATKVKLVPKEEQEEAMAMEDIEQEAKPKRGGRKKKVKEDVGEEKKKNLEQDEGEEKPVPKKRKASTTLKNATTEAAKKLKSVAEIVKKEDTPKSEDDMGRRRSTRRKN